MTKKVLAIIDVQEEFVSGALGNKDCEAAVKNIVAAVESGEYCKVIFTRDTHGTDYLNTQEGKRLPVVHGQEGSEGYELNSAILAAVREHFSSEDIIIVKKPTFGSLDFGNELKKIWDETAKNTVPDPGEYLMEVDFAGFCTGICVLSNVVIAKTFVPEARVCVIEKACACVTQETHKTAIAAMGPIQVDII